MKPIHECAVVKDVNRRAAYFIAKTDTCIDRDIIHKHWELVDAPTFEELVKNNQVQFLIWENNTIKCKYTHEEIQTLNGKMKREALEDTQANYWDMDVQFKLRHVEAANNCKAIACSLAGIMKAFGVTTLPMFMYGNVGFMVNLMNEVQASTRVNLSNSFKHNMENVGQLAIPLTLLDALLETPSGKLLVFDTSLVKYQLKEKTLLPKRGLVKQAKPEKAFTILNRIDRVTLDNEKYLGI